MTVRGFLYAYLSNYYYLFIGGCMAYLHRFLIILFLLLPSISWAVPPVAYYYVHSNIYNKSDAAVCSEYITYLNSVDPSGNYTQISCDGDTGNFGISSNGNNFNGGISKFYFCESDPIDADHKVASNFVCTPPPNNCTDGEKVIDQTVDSFSDTPFPPVSCIGGCEVLITKSSTPQIDCGFSASNNTVGICTYYSTLTGVKDGQTCTGSGAALPPVANLPTKPTPCPVCECLKAGKSWGTVNGTTVCVSAGSAGSNPVKFPNAPTVTTDPSGNTTNNYNNNNTSIEISNNSSSSSSGGSSGTGSGVPTVTSTKADGTKTTETLDNFCQQNPTSQYCKKADNGNFSGSCGGGFTCDGDDAVKCAIAQEEYKRNCQLFDNQTTLSTLGNALGSGVDPNASIDPTTHKTTTSIASSLIEDSHFSGELSDLSVSVGQFGSVNIPFSRLNTILTAMGYILLAFAYIAAVKIVGVS